MLFSGLTGYVPIWLLTDSTTVGPVVLKPDSQAYTETGISAGLPIATELRPPLACDLKTIAVVGSIQATDVTGMGHLGRRIGTGRQRGS